MDKETYVQFDGLGLADLIKKGEVTAQEVRAVALELVDDLNPELNAVLQRIDSPDSTASDEGPFSGVPFLIKEIILHAAGVPCRDGSRLNGDLAHPNDTELMRRFRAAGLQTIGTSQTPEFGYNATTESVAFGPVHNPFKHGYSPGGSSGGSSAAVAAGIVPIAHANDGGGSIRIPASCNSLIGLKPSRGRVPTGPDYANPLLGHATEFVVARSTRDCAAMLQAVSGPDIGSPDLIAPPEMPFTDYINRAPKRGMTVALMLESPLGIKPHSENAMAAEKTAKELESLGYQIETGHQIKLDFEEFAYHISDIWCMFLASGVRAVEAATGRVMSSNTVEAVTQTCVEYAETRSIHDLLAALNYVNRISREIGNAFENFDLCLTPTMALPPPPHGFLNQNDDSLDALDWAKKTFEYAAYTPFANSTGQPAISLPMHRTADGLPCGSQIIAGMGQEGLLLGVAKQLEKTSSWAVARPLIKSS